MSFLDSFNLLSKWTRNFGFNNFFIPKNRTALKIRLSTKIFAVLKLCLIVALLLKNNVTLNFSIKFNGINYSAWILSFFVCSVLFTHLYIEIRYRHRIWTIITGLCEIDSVVCAIIFTQSFYSHLLSSTKILYCYFSFWKLDEETWSKATSWK